MPVHFETRESVALMTLDRPEALNALDVASLAQVREHLVRYRDDPALRCLVVTGAGERAFCTGADLKAARDPSATYAEAFLRSKTLAADQGLYIRLLDWNDLDLHKPVVAAVNGYCLGGGLELALQCDVRVAADGASFGLPEVCVGSIPGVSGVSRLMRATGSSHALQMALTGERIDAARALACGLVSEVLPREQLLPRALQIAERIAANAPLAVQAVKKLSRQTPQLGEREAQELTELHWGVLRDTQDRLEGRAAFAQKRTARYQSR
ncbi:enoyl-CoA hydratase/isomerase family protein [Ramlibacter albus]|uniref:Enoyl-CoA hydratase/isomerase family protein n=1 Tax=Ramlibacter albus TaxID=2079448 RepID=A0A923MF96_9BURK|nr:enoyl-CoA hydratase/isomerase family protein [Ramlibacter albus]MBC5768194.1 enoyl-CoA hydratase/isomerase family protein [Ramlibacter albus]